MAIIKAHGALLKVRSESNQRDFCSASSAQHLHQVCDLATGLAWVSSPRGQTGQSYASPSVWSMKTPSYPRRALKSLGMDMSG